MPSKARAKSTIVSDPRRPDGLSTNASAGGGGGSTGRWEIYTNGDPVNTEFLFFAGEPVYYFNPSV